MKNFTAVAKVALSGDADKLCKLSASLPASVKFLATHVPALLRHLQGGGGGDADSEGAKGLAAAKCAATKSQQLLDGDVLVAAYQHRVASMLMVSALFLFLFFQSVCVTFIFFL
jgi:hypothetical protein